MNCIWILLLLCCGGNGNCGCNRCEERECPGERCRRRCERRCESVAQNICEDVCEDICDRSNTVRERIIPGVRTDFPSYDNNSGYERRSERRDLRNDARGTGRGDTCGCEA